MIEAFAPKFSKKVIKVIGGGLAGAEVALILARHGFFVHLFCNNENVQKSFVQQIENENAMRQNMEFELDCLCSPVFSLAKKFGFQNFCISQCSDIMFVLRKELEKQPNIQIFDGCIEKLNPSEPTVIATGHNTNGKLLQEIEEIVGKMRICHFNPQNLILDAKSVNLKQLNFETENICYANLSQQEYDAFYEKVRGYDNEYDSSTQQQQQISVEAIAKRGKEALKNSVLRPHFDGKSKAYASLKMKYNSMQERLFVEDFCSALEENEQVEIIHAISALSSCKVCQFAKIAKRTFLLAPSCLNKNLQIAPNVYVCGGFAGVAGALEALLLADFCAYALIGELSGKMGAQLLLDGTCIGKIMDNLLQKSVIKFRLFSLKYDIINVESLNKFEKEVEKQKVFSKNAIEKFKEKFYGKYF